MDKIPTNSILNFNPNQLSEVRKLFGYEDVNKLKQAIDQLDDWIKKQNHFVVRDFDREYLERYIIAHKGSVERAKKRLDRLCTLRNLMPEFLHNIDLQNELDPLLKCTHTAVLPKPTPDHYRVFLTTIHSDDHEKAELIHYYRYMVAYVEYLLRHDYNAGCELVLDYRKFTLSMISKLNPIVIHKAVTLFVEAYGLRLKALHLIIGSKFVDTIVSIIKQGLTEKLGKRIQVHNTVESLHKFIPREIIPVEYGGDERSIVNLAEENLKELRSAAHTALLKSQEQVVTDESCRSTSTFNDEYSGMPGSFKTLCVD